MNEVSLFRLYVLRAMYLLVFIGQGIVALSQWWSGNMDAATLQQVFNLSFVVLVYLAVPWSYIFKHYVKKPGDTWRFSIGRSAREVVL